MKRKLTDSSIEMEKMRDEMMSLVRQCDQKDEKLRILERRLTE